jgi:CBS-domain-containing membrane protein
MSCRDAMTADFLTLSPGEKVGDALARLKKAGLEIAPVADEDGKVAGVFSIQSVLRGLLPVSVAVSGGVFMDARLPAAPGIAKRLNRVLALTVSEVMERKAFGIDPETPAWEAVNALVTHGSPLMVIESSTGRAAGMITSQSALDHLYKQKDE